MPHKASKARYSTWRTGQDQTAIMRRDHQCSDVGQQKHQMIATRFTQPDTNEFTALVMQSFAPGSESITIVRDSDYHVPRVCGSWVEVLPNVPGSTILPHAVKALASSIPSRPNVSCASVDCSQSYHIAVRTLRKSLSANGHRSCIELMSSIMCLAIVEVQLSVLICSVMKV